MLLPEKLYGHAQSQLNHLCTHLYNIVSDTDFPLFIGLKRDRDALLRYLVIDVAEGACQGTLLVDPAAFKSSDFVAVRSKLQVPPAEAGASGNAAHLGDLHGEDTTEGQQAEQPEVFPASPAAHASQADLGRSTRKRAALSNITNQSGKQQRKDQGDVAAGQQTGTAPEHDADRRRAELPVQQLRCGSTPYHTTRTATTHYCSDAACPAEFAVDADLLEGCSWYSCSIKMAQRHAERVEAELHVKTAECAFGSTTQSAGDCCHCQAMAMAAEQHCIFVMNIALHISHTQQHRHGEHMQVYHGFPVSAAAEPMGAASSQHSRERFDHSDKRQGPARHNLADAVLAQLDKTMIGPLHSRKSAVLQARDTVLRSVVSEKLRPFLSHLSARWGVKKYILEHALEVAVAEHEDGLLFVAVRLERCDICLSISAGFARNDCLRLGRHHADCSHTSKQCMHHCH